MSLVHETAHEFLNKAEHRAMPTQTVRETEAEAGGLYRGPGRWMGDGQHFERLHPDVRGHPLSALKNVCHRPG